MRRVKRKFLIVAGLFISGLNPLWATSSQKITSNSRGIKEFNKNQIHNNQAILYELNSPDDLSLPSRSREVLVKTFKEINLDQLENILINNIDNQHNNNNNDNDNTIDKIDNKRHHNNINNNHINNQLY